jgi:Ankyrin repeat.
VLESQLEKGVNLYAINQDEETPLLQANIRGHKAVVKLLLNKGANIE